MTTAALLDIEGTVCSISFVHDILFPYALEKLPQLLAAETFPIREGTSGSSLLPYLQAFPEEYRVSAKDLENHVIDLSNQNLKIPYLKGLQGYIWKSGYEIGEIKAPLYPDAVEFMKRVVEQKGKVYIYSSGSVAAQKLLFGFSDAGDLNPLLSDYFDTVNAGPKVEKSSYEKILKAINHQPQEVLFLSDNVKEIKAAKEAGLKAYVADRPGNAPLTEEDKKANVVVDTFANIDLKKL